MCEKNSKYKLESQILAIFICDIVLFVSGDRLSEFSKLFDFLHLCVGVFMVVKIIRILSHPTDNSDNELVYSDKESFCSDSSDKECSDSEI